MRYGCLARFSDEHALLAATRRVRDEGYRHLDAYCPQPSEALAEVLGRDRTRLPWVMFVAGTVGGLSAYFMQWYATVVSYPLNIGGRPEGSTPSYFPITFELTVLSATLIGVIAMIWRSGLPRLHHPLFAVPSFVQRASQDGYFLCIEATDPLYQAEKTVALLRGLESLEVVEVEE